MYYVTVRTEFAAAHALRGYRGKCENLHGHNFKVEVTLKGRELDRCGMLVDFADVKARLNELVGALDHQNLNELEPFASMANPSAENIAKHLHDGIAKLLPAGVRVDAVSVFETDRCSATYREEP